MQVLAQQKRGSHFTCACERARLCSCYCICSTVVCRELQTIQYLFQFHPIQYTYTNEYESLDNAFHLVLVVRKLSFFNSKPAKHISKVCN